MTHLLHSETNCALTGGQQAVSVVASTGSLMFSQVGGPSDKQALSVHQPRNLHPFCLS